MLRDYGIPGPSGFLIRSATELPAHLDQLGNNIVLKAQVDVGGRGTAGGILMTDKMNAVATAQGLFGKEIKVLPVREILAEQRLDIRHEYYLSITVDRSSKKPLILFTEAGGVDIEITAKEHPEAIHKVIANPLMRDIPPFMIRELVGTAPKEIGPIVNKLYCLFIEKDALLAEINPLVTTAEGVFAAEGWLAHAQLVPTNSSGFNQEREQMPTAYCKKCGNLVHWRNRRGNKLSKMACPPPCGRSLKRAAYVWDDASKTGGYVAGPLD